MRPKAKRAPHSGPRPDELLPLKPISWRGSSAASAVAAGVWLLASLGWSLSTLTKVTGSINPLMVAGDVGVLAVLVWLAVRWRGTYGLEVIDDDLFYTRLRGTRRVLRVGQPGRIVELDVQVGGSSYGHLSRMWCIVLDDGTIPLKINRLAWDHAELERLREHLRLRLEAVDGVQSGEQANTRYPGLIRNWALHPWRSAILVVAVPTVIATIISLALHPASHR